MKAKSIVSLLLTVAMLLTMLPAFTMSTNAAADIQGVAAGINTGDKVYYGKYPQTEIRDISGLTEGVDYITAETSYNDSRYFLIEPLEWRVLRNENGKLFLLSEKIIDARKAYHTTYALITWEDCTMRKWLNGYDGNPYGYSFIDWALGVIIYLGLT